MNLLGPCGALLLWAGASEAMPAMPPAPAREDPLYLEPGPWRGVAWLTLRLDLIAPLAGQRPARGSVLAASGGFEGGWRLHRMFGLYAGVSTFLHDRERRTAYDPAQGEERVELANGRMVLFDPVVLRVFVPRPRRVEPYLDVGGTVGGYRAPFATRGQATGGLRVGTGLDVWLAPTVSLALNLDHRVLWIGRRVGYAILGGAGLTFHR